MPAFPTHSNKSSKDSGVGKREQERGNKNQELWGGGVGFDEQMDWESWRGDRTRERFYKLMLGMREEELHPDVSSAPITSREGFWPTGLIRHQSKSAATFSFLEASRTCFTVFGEGVSARAA